mmetsp:Transcript_22068/g.43413  ORF Transcript_22068/g.43413 Transcript_22068/m.43413 type:complete len:239 (-) Transcript_22068:1802-2518(-)
MRNLELWSLAVWRCINHCNKWKTQQLRPKHIQKCSITNKCRQKILDSVNTDKRGCHKHTVYKMHSHTTALLMRVLVEVLGVKLVNTEVVGGLDHSRVSQRHVKTRGNINELLNVNGSHINITIRKPNVFVCLCPALKLHQEAAGNRKLLAAKAVGKVGILREAAKYGSGRACVHKSYIKLLIATPLIEASIIISHNNNKNTKACFAKEAGRAPARGQTRVHRKLLNGLCTNFRLGGFG